MTNFLSWKYCGGDLEGGGGLLLLFRLKVMLTLIIGVGPGWGMGLRNIWMVPKATPVKQQTLQEASWKTQLVLFSTDVQNPRNYS